MSYSNLGEDFINDIVYNLRLEYTGYLDIAKFVTFVNDVMLNTYMQSVNNMPVSVLNLTYPKLKVVTNNVTTSNSLKLPPIKSDNLYGDGPSDYSRLFPIPKMSYDQQASVPGFTELYEVNYPNIARIAKITVIDDDLSPQPFDVDDESPDHLFLNFSRKQVQLVSASALEIAKKRYYRKPDNDRIYAVLLNQTNSFTVLEVTTDQHYIILEYFRYPSPIENNDSDILDLSEAQLNVVKDAAMVKFLERIKDERFKNYISKKG